MLASLLISVVMLVGKLTAYFLTHSAAIFSDAAESVVHGAATGLAAFSLWYAARPPDASHPYGHGRIAYFSVGFEGALVLAAALVVIYNCIRDLIRGPELKNLGLGLLIASGLAVINLVLAQVLIRVGKRHNSLILISNGKHVMSDVWTTLAAVLGVGMVMLTGVPWLDPLIGLLIAAVIMATGISLIRRSTAGLLDEVDPALSGRLLDLLQQQARDGAIADFHQLRFRKVNDEMWIDLHVLVPGELTVSQAHARVTKIEERIRAALPGERVRITSHIEPADHESAHPGGHRGVDPLSPATALRGEEP